MLNSFKFVLKRDLLIAWRNWSDLYHPLLLFLLIIILFPLAVTPEAATLRLIAPGVIWVAALTSNLLAFDRLFASDFRDGSIENLLLAPQALWILVFAKVIAHWCVTALPLIVFSPLLALFFKLSFHEYTILLITLCLATPLLSLLGGIISAITVGLRNGGLLLALLLLPLYIPILIFASQALYAVEVGMAVTTQLALLAALLALGISLAPLATAAALRIGNEL